MANHSFNWAKSTKLAQTLYEHTLTNTEKEKFWRGWGLNLSHSFVMENAITTELQHHALRVEHKRNKIFWLNYPFYRTCLIFVFGQTKTKIGFRNPVKNKFLPNLIVTYWSQVYVLD